MRIATVFLVLVVPATLLAEETNLDRTKEGLQKVGSLIGTWKGTGQPLVGSSTERREGFWIETVDWQWKFAKDRVRLVVKIDKGKYFTGGELRFDPKTELYELTLGTTDEKKLTFSGKYDEKKLVLDRDDPTTKEKQRLAFHLIHHNRHFVRYEVKAANRASFRPIYRVGNTKQGVAFASGDDKPECIVSGGLGTSPVMYKGKTYYVCCSGCRDAFFEEPEKYIREFEASKNKKK